VRPGFTLRTSTHAGVRGRRGSARTGPPCRTRPRRIVLTGLRAATPAKRAGRHPRSGNLYVAALLVVAATALVPAALRGRQVVHLAVLPTAVFWVGPALVGTPLVVRALRRHGTGSVPTAR
jgi:hypothetical protein